jgi:hypothetical protein
MNRIHVLQMVPLPSSQDSRSSTGEDRVMRCHILLEGDLQNRVCEIVTKQLGHDGSMMQLQRVEVDRDFEFDTTGCYARHIQQIERYRLYSNQFL